MGPRLYDPELGRMLQPDPFVPGAGDPQAYNRYGYDLNSPLRYTDPSGFQPVCDDPRCAPLPDVGGAPFPFPTQQPQIVPQLILDLPRIFEAAQTIGRNIGEGFSRLRFPQVRARAFEGTTESAAGNAGSHGQQRTELFSLFGGAIRILPTDVENPGQGAGALQGVGLVLGGLGTKVLGRALLGALSRPALISLGAGLPPAVQSAGPKLADLATRFGTTRPELVRNVLQTGSRFADLANKGNVNAFLQRPDAAGFIRVTLDPGQQRIISAGLVRARQVANGIANGRFVPLE